MRKIIKEIDKNNNKQFLIQLQTLITNKIKLDNN